MKVSSLKWFAIFLAVVVFFGDALLKQWVHQNLPIMGQANAGYPYGGIGVFQNFFGIDFSIVHTINRGAAWGMLAKWQDYLLYVRIGVILALIIFMIGFNKRISWTIPLALIVAGAAGNVLDYFIYGHVVDMFQFVFWGYEYPVFNIADSAIFVGVISLLILSWRDQQLELHE